MSALKRFEQFMENMVEGSVARMFGSPIQPAEIAKRLERAMESQQTISVRRVIVPNAYRVFLHPRDYAAFEPIRADLEREMGTYLTDLANERNFAMLEHPKVEMLSEETVPRRTIQVTAETVQASAAEGATRVMSSTVRLKAQEDSSNRALLLLETPDGVHPIPLETTLLTLGRGLNNDIVLEDTRVSRHHAQLRYRTRHFWITDLGSTNGTFVNGEAVSDIALRSGDVISLGGLELLFREGTSGV
jgi:pSer/pThr/pTyr-binding forkhead associated (FHA) protein